MAPFDVHDYTEINRRLRRLGYQIVDYTVDSELVERETWEQK
jgi:hypothetical protein